MVRALKACGEILNDPRPRIVTIYALADDVEGVQLGFIGTPADRFRNIQDWVLYREQSEHRQ